MVYVHLKSVDQFLMKKQVRKKRPTSVAFPEFNQKSWHDKLQTPESHKKNIVKSPILELEKRLKFGMWEVRPSHRHSPGYISACFFNPATSSSWAI